MINKNILAKMTPLRWEALLAALWTLSGVLIGVSGGSFHGFEVPNWGGWVMAATGVLVFTLCMRAIVQGKDTSKPRDYTDEDVSKGLSELERMYVKDHGTLPEYPDEAPFDAKTEKKE